MVRLFNNAINLLTTHCGSTVLLCTATQPLLDWVDLGCDAVTLAPEPELNHNVADTFRRLYRYVVFDHSHRSGGWTREQVAELACDEARTRQSALLIVNTKTDALEIFKLCRKILPEDARVVHLSTGICPAHRKLVLNQLKVWLDEESPSVPLLCVSTQLIEDGVDIDFAAVVRDLAGLDSIAQAVGAVIDMADG